MSSIRNKRKRREKIRNATRLNNGKCWKCGNQGSHYNGPGQEYTCDRIQRELGIDLKGLASNNIPEWVKNQTTPLSKEQRTILLESQLPATRDQH